jgi:hypothetical protein
MAAWTTRDMRRAAGLAREELLPGLGGDEVPRANVLPGLDGDEVSKADVLGDLEVDELPALLPLGLADANPCASRLRMPLDSVPTRTSLPPGRALVGVLSIARRIDVGLGVCPITRR